MTTKASAGYEGPKVRDDCHVALETAAGAPLDLHVECLIEECDGADVEARARRVLDSLGVATGSVRIRDSGAPDFALAARIEACVKKAGMSDSDLVPGMIAANRYASARKRKRLSRLYLPGNTPKMMIKAGGHRPNGIILDLEDSVALARKPEARLLVRNALCAVDFLGAERMVRINQLPLGLEDLEQVVPYNVHMILIPKCESAETVAQVNDAIENIKAATGTSGDVYLMPIIESSKGVLNAEKIAAAAGNIVALTIGLEDYTADIGVRRTLEGAESFYARSHLVNVCKAYGLQAIDSVFSDVGDMEALAGTVARSKALGFEGMGCIHPRQIEVVHAGYAPDQAEIEKAGRIVLAFEEAARNGLGVVSLGSKMIDPPVVERARRTIEQAVAMKILDPGWRQSEA